METKKNKSNLKMIIAAICALVLCVGIFAIVYSKFGPESKTTKGGKSITIEVVGKDGKTSSYKLDTDAKFLKEAMDELVKATKDKSGDKKFTYSGSTSTYGLYIEKVNDVEANYDKDKAYWAIYVKEASDKDFAYGQYGADQQPVTDKATYKFVYEKSEN